MDEQGTRDKIVWVRLGEHEQRLVKMMTRAEHLKVAELLRAAIRERAMARGYWRPEVETEARPCS